jgi:hypothetical protein
MGRSIKNNPAMVINELEVWINLLQHLLETT